jgi:PAS domain S-box-containing protein
MTTQILVVNERAEEVDTALSWLREQGYTVTLTTSGDQARQMIKEAPPDLVLADTESPEVDGAALCRWLRQGRTSSDLPIILMTASPLEDAQAECAEAGANDFITKPIRIADLWHKLGTILSKNNLPPDDNRRLLEETCQAALVIVPCNLAWLLTTESRPESTSLVSQTIATDQGYSAGQVFLRLVGGGAPEAPSFPLEARDNPLSKAARSIAPLVNLSIQQFRHDDSASYLFRGANQLRLSFIHCFPLRMANHLTGMLVLATKEQIDVTVPRSQQILSALISQAATGVENVRLVMDLEAREEEMKAEQTFRKMILDTMGDGLVVIDEQAIIRYVNSRLLRMSGYSRDELYGNSVGVIFHPSGREILVNSLRRRTRATVSFSQQLVTKNGAVVPVLMSRATPPPNSSGERSTVLVLTDLTEQKRREQELELQSQRLRALNRAAQAITSALTLDDVLMVLLHSAAEIVQCTSACLFLKDTDTPDTFSVVAAIGTQGDSLRDTTIRLGEGIAGQVAETHRSQLVSYVQLDGLPNHQVEHPGSSVIAVPLIVMDQVIGVLETVNQTAGQFTQDNVEILENLAAAGSVAIENARLFDQTQRRVTELSTLLEASAAASSTLDIGSILELITRRLSEALNAARCSIAAWDQVAGQLTVLAEVCNAYWSPGQGPVRPLADTSLAAKVIEDGQVAIAIADDPHLDPLIADYLHHLKMRSVVLLPLRFGPTVAGMIELYNAQLRPDMPYVRAVEDSVIRWREQVRKRGSSEWSERDNLTDLFQRILRAGEVNWCTISTWSQQDPTVRSIREMGFVLWQDQASVIYSLLDYPLMAQSLIERTSVTLELSDLRDDPNEFHLMAQTGMQTGLIVPVLVHGEASGLVKLLDVVPGRVFDFAEISLCQGIANVVGNAIENAQLYQSLERRANALQAAYDELHRADKVKDDLIQNISHELQTPLHQVVMQLDLLANEAFGSLNHEQRDNMDIIINKITTVGELVRDMVSLHTLSTQKMQFGPAEIAHLIEDSILNAQAKAAGAGLGLVVNVPPTSPSVWADSQRLVEVIDQLIDNAIKFSPQVTRKADRIDITAQDGNGPTIQVSVRDYGIGINRDEFENIFHVGYQIDGSITRRYGGTGLGLSLARQIIEAHGGRIWVESTAGGGSTFHFTIPKTGVQFVSGQ